MPKYLLLVLICIVVVPGCATSFDVQSLETQVASLKQQNQALSASIDQLKSAIASQKSKEYDIKGQFAGQDAEFDRLRNEVRVLKGNVEEIQYQTNQGLKPVQSDMQLIKGRLDNDEEKISFNDARISKLESYMGLESADKFKAHVAASLPAKKEPGSLTEDELYAVAKQTFDKKDYDSALQGFQTFLRKYPKSQLANNCVFWIGEVYFAEKWYEKAILQYEEVIKKYPKGNKVPAAYLKQGIAFSKIGETANARLILKELIQKFPDSNEAKIARKELAEIK